MMHDDVLARLRRADPYPDALSYDEATLNDSINRAMTRSEDTVMITLSSRKERGGTARRWLTPGLAGAAVLGVAVGVFIAARDPGAYPQLAASRPVPPPPSGYTAAEFRMASPLGGDAHGPAPVVRPTCTPAEVTAIAATRRTINGVLGVIRLTGAIVSHRYGEALRCSLPVNLAYGPTNLTTRDRRPLPVPLSHGDTTDPPSNPRPDLALNDGRAIWGFAWLGSYCGPAAAAITMPLEHTSTPLSAPLSGPQPSCRHHANTSHLIPGRPGAPGQPVQSPIPAYSKLRLTGHIESGTTTKRLAPIRMTLRTIGTAPVYLDPCPAYGGRDVATASTGDFSDPIGTHSIGCQTRTTVITPTRPLHWTVRVTSMIQTPNTGAKPGSTVKVTISVAGVPPLDLQTKVSR